jgi:hypothetical protein
VKDTAGNTVLSGVIAHTSAISAVVFTPVTAGRHTLQIRVDGEPLNTENLGFVAVADAAAAEVLRHGKPSARHLAKMELEGAGSAAESFSRSLLATARKIIASGVAESAVAAVSAPAASAAATGKQPASPSPAVVGAVLAQQPKKAVPAGKRQIKVGEHDVEVRCFPEMDALVVGHLAPGAVIEVSGEQMAMDQGIWVKLSAACTAEVAEPDFKHFDAWVLQSASDGYGGGVFYNEMDDTPCQSWTEFTQAEEAARLAKQEELRQAEAAKAAATAATEAAAAAAAAASETAKANTDAVQDAGKVAEDATGDSGDDVDTAVAEPDEPKLAAQYSFRQARAIRAAFAAVLWHGNVTQVRMARFIACVAFSKLKCLIPFFVFPSGCHAAGGAAQVHARPDVSAFCSRHGGQYGALGYPDAATAKRTAADAGHSCAGRGRTTAAGQGRCVVAAR